jgi:hypothetical protein
MIQTIQRAKPSLQKTLSDYKEESATLSLAA